MSESKQSGFLNTPVRRFEVYFLVGISFIVILFTGIMQQSQDIRSIASEPAEVESGRNTLSIVGYVYVDQNKNGERDLEERSFPNAKIKIERTTTQPTPTPSTGTPLVPTLPGTNDPVVVNRRSDSNGYFKYEIASNQVPNPVSYKINLELPTNYSSTTQNPIMYADLGRRAKRIVEFGIAYDGDIPIPSINPTIVVTPIISATITPADYVISGTVFNDGNSNGIRDTNEVGEANVPVTIRYNSGNNNEIVVTLTTNNRGVYRQIVSYGNYAVSIQVAGNRHLTTPASVSVVLPPNAVANFGIAPNPR